MFPTRASYFTPQLTAASNQRPQDGAFGLACDVDSQFGRRLKQLRLERNMTQEQMAVRFGIDRSYISDVERGRKSMSLSMLEVVALGMKISLSELFRGL